MPPAARVNLLLYNIPERQYMFPGTDKKRQCRGNILWFLHCRHFLLSSTFGFLLFMHLRFNAHPGTRCHFYPLGEISFNCFYCKGSARHYYSCRAWNHREEKFCPELSSGELHFLPKVQQSLQKQFWAAASYQLWHCKATPSGQNRSQEHKIHWLFNRLALLHSTVSSSTSLLGLSCRPGLLHYMCYGSKLLTKMV